MSSRRLWPLLIVVPMLACESNPAAPTGGGLGGGSSDGTQLNQGFEADVVALMNQHRSQGATCGGDSFGSVGSLTMNGNLQQAARDHSIDMVER